ncbi:MAG: LSm family protein [Desulfosoma sp.]
MSGIVVEKKDGKTIITVVQKESERDGEDSVRTRSSETAQAHTTGRRTFLHDVLGRRLLFYLTTGEEVEGILDGFDHESLRLEDAFLYGEKKEWRADWMIVERRQLVTVSPAGRIRRRPPSNDSP